MKRLKILVSCYACSPFRGSEPGMGWSFILGISKYHEVHVITEKEKWETEISNYFKKNPVLNKNIKFYFIRKKRNRKLRKIWPPSYYWFYKGWQKEAYKLAVQLHRKEFFDLTHQLNMVGFREPGYLWNMDVPFVWGPIGGMEISSWKFLPSIGVKGMIHFAARNMINEFQKRFAIRPKKAANRSNSILIAATSDNQKEILKYWKIESEVICEVGQIENLKIKPKARKSGPLKIIWSGIHEPRKNLILLLKSLKKVNIEWELHILGVGPETKKWQNASVNLEISEKCIWYGWVPRETVFDILRKGHIFCLTSIHDLTSTVLLEALSFGLPVICLDHCGFSDVVDDSCGIKIPILNPKEAISGFVEAIEKMSREEGFRLELAHGAIKRAKYFSWSGKIDKLNDYYCEITS